MGQSGSEWVKVGQSGSEWIRARFSTAHFFHILLKFVEVEIPLKNESADRFRSDANVAKSAFNPHINNPLTRKKIFYNDNNCNKSYTLQWTLSISNSQGTDEFVRKRKFERERITIKIENFTNKAKCMGYKGFRLQF